MLVRRARYRNLRDSDSPWQPECEDTMEAVMSAIAFRPQSLRLHSTKIAGYSLPSNPRTGPCSKKQSRLLKMAICVAAVRNLT